MEQLKFREEFCEETLAKAMEQKRNSFGLPRKLALVACVCLCTMALLGTALAVSPGLRALLIPNVALEGVETPALPQETNISVETDFQGLQARYYKLDGSIVAPAGMGSVIPVEKDGKLSFYSISETGKLELAKAPRIIRKELSYKDRSWSLDLKIYDGDKTTVVSENDMYSESAKHLTLGRTENNVWMPVIVDTETWAITDPMGCVSFTPDADAISTQVNYEADSVGLLIKSLLDQEEDTYRYYYANAETGDIRYVGEGSANSYVLRGGKVYCYKGGKLTVSNGSGTSQPLFEGSPCTFDGGDFAYCVEGTTLRVLKLSTGEEYDLENCADSHSDPSITANPCGTMFALSSFRLSAGAGLDTNSISLVDPAQGKMYTLERDPNMYEQMCGWFDNENYFIAGTIDGEWYICLYCLS